MSFSNLRIGKYGLEKFFDNKLRGEFGRRREEVNARGKIITSNLYEKPNPGKNLKLSIDLNIQSFALTRLQNLNPKNGIQKSIFLKQSTRCHRNRRPCWYWWRSNS